MPGKILFFCAANTGILAADRFAGCDAEIVSAGLYASEGAPASEGSVAAAAQRGLDLSEHRSRPLDHEALAGVDWAIGMTAEQVEVFRRWFPGFAGRLGLLGLPGVDLMRTGVVRADADVADPYLGAGSAYGVMAGRVEELVESWRTVVIEGEQE